MRKLLQRWAIAKSVGRDYYRLQPECTITAVSTSSSWSPETEGAATKTQTRNQRTSQRASPITATPVLGHPSNAASSVASIDNYLMVKPQYVLCYNNKTHTANWVSWQLNKSWIGTAVSLDNFRPDEALPAAWYKVRPNDYTVRGYDRGHIAPSADRTRFRSG